jgi:hypothetical protein
VHEDCLASAFNPTLYVALRQALEECAIELHLWLQDCAIREEIDTLLFDAVTGLPLTDAQGQ